MLNQLVIRHITLSTCPVHTNRVYCKIKYILQISKFQLYAFCRCSRLNLFLKLAQKVTSDLKEMIGTLTSLYMTT